MNDYCLPSLSFVIGETPNVAIPLPGEHELSLVPVELLTRRVSYSCAKESNDTVLLKLMLILQLSLVVADVCLAIPNSRWIKSFALFSPESGAARF